MWENLNFWSLFNKKMCSITLSPTALFQIIKDIKMGSSDHGQGRLSGMPSDGQGSPIEVTHAFPDYGKKDYSASTNEEEVEKFAKNHLRQIKKLNFDNENVGWYTSQNCGRRLNFKDLNKQHQYQKNDSSFFCLVVDLSGSSLSLRAFRISDKAMAFLEGKDTSKDSFSVIDESMYYKELLQEYDVSFSLSPLDQVITTEILSSFNLIADVFRLRNPSTFQGNVPIIADSIDNIEKSLKDFTSEKHKIRNNAVQREKWLQERRQTNIKREAKLLPPLPEDEVDTVLPVPNPSNKLEFMSNLYQFNANSSALHEELDEEITKMEALVNLGAEK